MSKLAYFFAGDSFLIQDDGSSLDVSAAQITSGFSVELSREFKDVDVFEIPALDEPGFMINAVSVSKDAVLPENWKAVPVRQIIALSGVAGNGDLVNFKRILRACHIAQWRRASRFCGTCGTQNNDTPAQTQRLCPKCGRMEFPRICPAVIVIITDDEDRILLAHNTRFRKGVYSHISGYVEAGETLEETAVREVREEVSIEIKDIEYIQSQPWPFPDSLMLGFKASYSSGTIKCDGEEIEDAKWFTKDNLPELGGQGALSRILINNWLAGNL